MNPCFKAVNNIFQGINSSVNREIDFYQTRPVVATWFLTYRCTSRCATCTTWRRPANPKDELSLSDWKKIADISFDVGIRNIELFGGDVLLRKDILIPLIRYLKEKKFVIHMPTNSNLLDETTARNLVETQVDFLYLSTDGIEDIHDGIRGVKGTFNNVKRAVAYLANARGKAQKPKLICNTTISKYNIDYLEDIAAFASTAGYDDIFFEYVGEMTQEHIENSMIEGLKPTPYYVRQGDSVLINKEQAATLKKRLRKIRDFYLNKKLGVLIINVETLSERDFYMGTIPNHNCYVERREITVDPYGNVAACLFINNYILGNILKDDFSNIWNNEAHLKFRKYQNSGKLAMCNHCILGVERNHSFFMDLKRNLFYSHNWIKEYLSRYRKEKEKCQQAREI
jgi:MoaA/NifB/PqqE/SkfB family radical SAM enzyme